MTEPKGLQGERTALAWSRTVLAIAAVAALIVRTADSGFERAVATLLAAGGLILAVLTAARRRGAITGADLAAAPVSTTFGTLLGALASLAAAGLVVIL